MSSSTPFAPPPTTSSGEFAGVPSPPVEDDTEVLDEEMDAETFESQTASDEEGGEDAPEEEATEMPMVSDQKALSLGWTLTYGRNAVVGGSRSRIRMVERDEFSIGNVLSLKGVDHQIQRARAEREREGESDLVKSHSENLARGD